MIKPTTIVREACIEVYSARSRLTRVLALPACLWVIADICAAFGSFPLLYIVAVVLALFVPVWIAITIHRLILLDAQSIPEWGLSQIGLRELMYLGCCLGAKLLIVGALFLFFPRIWLGGWYTPPVFFSLVLLVGYLLIRCCLVLPGIAIDRGFSLSESWRLTERCQLPFIAAVICFPLLTAAFMSALESLSVPAGSVFAMIANVLVTLIEVAGHVLFIATLSVAYRALLRFRETSDSVAF